MRVFDFDKTIYKNDSSFEFYLYCIKEKPVVVSVLPKFIFWACKYKLGIATKTQMKTVFFSYLKHMDSIEETVESFWSDKSLMTWYIKDVREEDVIISASPEFLVKPMMEKYGIKKVLASDVDEKTGEFYLENCYGEEKVIRFKNSKFYGEIDEFYSDSYSDSPLAQMAKKAYMMKDGESKQW